MPTEHELLAAVLARPNEDAERHALAEYWRERRDPRAELIESSLELAQLEINGTTNAHTRGLRQRIRQLIAEHGDSLTAHLKSLVDEVDFFRGLPALVVSSVDRFVVDAPMIFAAAPIQHANLKAPSQRFRELCESPYLGKLRSLALTKAGLGDSDAEALAASPHAANLRWISLANNQLGSIGIEALVASPYLARCEFLSTSGNPVDATPRLSGLDYDGTIHAIEESPLGLQLEKKYGHRPWLHADGVKHLWDWPPARDVPTL